MTPQEVQRTMDFILRSHADAVIRMERWDERSDEQHLWKNQRVKRPGV